MVDQFVVYLSRQGVDFHDAALRFACHGFGAASGVRFLHEDHLYVVFAAEADDVCHACRRSLLAFVLESYLLKAVVAGEVGQCGVEDGEGA